MILAHDTQELLQWASINEQRLLAAKIDLLTVADRSTIQMMITSEPGEPAGDAGLSCPGFRLDLPVE